MTEIIFEVTEKGQICSDIQKEYLGSIAECKDAAEELGLAFIRNVGQVSSHPRACHIYLNDYVYWNGHETGRRESMSQSICRMGGKYLRTSSAK